MRVSKTDIHEIRNALTVVMGSFDYLMYTVQFDKDICASGKKGALRIVKTLDRLEEKNEDFYIRSSIDEPDGMRN